MDIRHEAASSRFALHEDGNASVLSYVMRGDDHIHFVRTWVHPAYRNRGYGAGLVKAGLEHARERGLTVSTSCWFVEAFIVGHPEYRDLLEAERRITSDEGGTGRP